MTHPQTLTSIIRFASDIENVLRLDMNDESLHRTVILVALKNYDLGRSFQYDMNYVNIFYKNLSRFKFINYFITELPVRACWHWNAIFCLKFVQWIIWTLEMSPLLINPRDINLTSSRQQQQLNGNNIQHQTSNWWLLLFH